MGFPVFGNDYLAQLKQNIFSGHKDVF